MTQNDPRRNTNTWWQQLILHFAETKLGTQLAATKKTKTTIPEKRNISNPIYEKKIEKFQDDYEKERSSVDKGLSHCTRNFWLLTSVINK